MQRIIRGCRRKAVLFFTECSLFLICFWCKRADFPSLRRFFTVPLAKIVGECYFFAPRLICTFNLRGPNMDTITLQRAMSYEPPTLLINKYCREHEVSEAKARERFEETKKFLVVCASDRSINYSPNEAVDMMWHIFILCSRDYFKF